VTDRIIISCRCPEPLKGALVNFSEYVRSETLATELSWELRPGTAAHQIEIEEYKAEVQVRVITV
jgi:hypothetical protein